MKAKKMAKPLSKIEAEIILFGNVTLASTTSDPIPARERFEKLFAQTKVSARLERLLTKARNRPSP